ncbi:hypothetical protein EUGRSUZ_C02753 [Eucalyptus grandis]|uniref:Uncharacterized protein n=2 Tax=Eucalyptus grandis TaxID=71139 RepID=A0ACC3LIJ7_EUCGR|nr:hypothetical protein EUGRSUZ_C02753 [Eucalyptus grandis]
MDTGPLVQKAQCMNLNDGGQDVHSSTQFFLRLKDVVSIRLLSKRWEHLSRNNPSLHIFERDFPGQTCFVNFLLHDFPLKVLSLISDTVSDKSCIHTWITAAIKRRVEKLHLRLYGDFEYVLPICVFNCETLIDLSIYGFDFDCESDSSVLEKFLSCPSLEDLTLIHCKWRRLEVLHISAPKLLSLKIVDRPFYEGLKSTFDLVVHGPRINSFTYNGQFIDGFTISTPSSLVVARIDINLCMFDLYMSDLYLSDLFVSGSPHHHHRAYNEYKLLKNLSSVKRLALFNPAKGIYVNSVTADAIFDPPPRCFQSSLEVIEIRSFEAVYEGLLAMKILLRTAGVLKKVFIYPRRAEAGQQLPGNLLQHINALPRASDQCELLLGV